MSWIKDVLDWDEARDAMQAPVKALKAPWSAQSAHDRQLLDALADNEWVSEGALCELLGWSKAQFLVTTVRMILIGWIKARPANSLFKSEYRLSSEVWK